MENASRALIMAASVLIAIVIVSAFILMMSGLTDYQEKSYQSDLSAQITEFNNQYSTYDKKDVRGSDMISLMNRVVDYNYRSADEEGYTEMEIKITISNSIRNNLSYDKTNRLILKNTYTQDDIDDIVGMPTSINNNISTGTIRNIENKYEQKYANQLASEISNIESIAENSSLNTTGQNKDFDNLQILPKSASSYGGVSQIYKDALIYYEYVQFKRTYFDCKNTEYDTNTGRIVKMEFECTGIGV